MSDQEQTSLGTTRGAIEESRQGADQRTTTGSRDPNWTGSADRPEGIEPRGSSTTGTGGESFGSTTDWGAGNGSSSMTGTGSDSDSESGSGSGSMQDQVREQADKVISTATQKVSGIAGQASSSADAGIEKAAGGLGTLAGTIRDKSQSLGNEQIGSIATAAADRLESGAELLRGQNTDQLMSELEALVRRKPVESMLVAAGIGFVLSKALR
jgi:ElaB/YqjD/DUF883 family membrane-anchored ribosome-binding protein